LEIFLLVASGRRRNGKAVKRRAGEMRRVKKEYARRRESF